MLRLSIAEARKRGLIGRGRFEGCEWYADMPLSEFQHLDTLTVPKNFRKVRRYVAGLGVNPMEPIVISHSDSGRWWLRDGNHRLRSARELDWETIPVVFAALENLCFRDWD